MGSIRKSEVRQVFEALDTVRLLAEKSVEEVASLCGVTIITYKRWRKGSNIKPWRLETLKRVLIELNRSSPRPIQHVSKQIKEMSD